jgi:hypothetical protein
MVKSFAPQTEMNQMDAQRLMFKWKETKLENVFGDKIEETTTHAVSLQNNVCSEDTNVMHVRALPDWMKMLLLTAPSEANMRTLLEGQGDPHLNGLSPSQHKEWQRCQRIYNDYAAGAAALKTLKTRKKGSHVILPCRIRRLSSLCTASCCCSCCASSCDK